VCDFIDSNATVSRCSTVKRVEFRLLGNDARYTAMMDNIMFAAPAQKPAKKRLSAAASAKKAPGSPLAENDDAAEKAGRRVKPAAAANGKASGKASESATVKKVSNEKLTELYAMCINMATQNQINQVRLAFGALCGE
jgi:hypothetical protein